MHTSNSPERSKPTIILVHGAFADSSSWNDVVDRLTNEGYPTIAVANPLRGLEADAEYLRSVFDHVGGPIVVAGHSYGGSVLSQAAADHPDVKALVYLASFQPDVGESAGELAAKFPGGELGNNLAPVPFPTPDGGTGTDLYIKQETFGAAFAADLPSDVTARMAVTQRPIASTALEDKATKAAWKTIPSWSLIAKQDLAIPLESQRYMSERAGSHTSEVDASHAITVSRPAETAAVIIEAARSVTD